MGAEGSSLADVQAWNLEDRQAFLFDQLTVLGGQNPNSTKEDKKGLQMGHPDYRGRSPEAPPPPSVQKSKGGGAGKGKGGKRGRGRGRAGGRAWVDHLHRRMMPVIGNRTNT